MPPTSRSPYRLLVEGSDDQYSVIHLMARHGYAWDDPSSHRPFVHNTGNLSKLLSAHEAHQRGARCKPVDHLKSALHTWLAWQEEPGLPFGTALRAQVFRHDSEDALRFVAWFNRLFVDA